MSLDPRAIAGAFLPTVLALALCFAASSAISADIDRGKSLHETHCGMCHDSVAYKRDSRIAKTYEEVRAQVTRWQTNTSLRWSDQDIEDVTAYLAKTYYKIPCPSC
ncbi:MAG: cytochrome C [Proteobacteria bacterium]|nr:MAG: cytochrome C [Pseudomonadota bacterium]